ncbi:hypothetical protein INT43_000390, partial [Umbelopsis isabellina]
MERVTISDALELALDSASLEYQAQSSELARDESSDENEDAPGQLSRKRKREDLLGLTQSALDEHDDRPSCPICLQPYIDRSYLRPCYHSFCFQCIRQWFKVGNVCPLCKQDAISLIYNVGERSGTFLEYKFNGVPSIPDSIYEQITRNTPSETMGQRAITHRRRIYHDNMLPDPGYPQTAQRHINTTHVEPYNIAKIKPFVQRDLRALLEELYDPLIEKQVLEILLIPHRRNIEARKARGKSAQERREMRISMDDAVVIDSLSEWIRGGENDKGFARRFVAEVMAFLRSGMDLNSFTTNVHYHRQ